MILIMEINFDASDDLTTDFNQSRDIDLDNRDHMMEAEDDSLINGVVSDIIRLYKYIQACVSLYVSNTKFVCIFPIRLSICL